MSQLIWMLGLHPLLRVEDDEPANPSSDLAVI